MILPKACPPEIDEEEMSFLIEVKYLGQISVKITQCANGYTLGDNTGQVLWIEWWHKGISRYDHLISNNAFVPYDVLGLGDFLKTTR